MKTYKITTAAAEYTYTEVEIIRDGHTDSKLISEMKFQVLRAAQKRLREIERLEEEISKLQAALSFEKSRQIEIVEQED